MLEVQGPQLGDAVVGFLSQATHAEKLRAAERVRVFPDFTVLVRADQVDTVEVPFLARVLPDDGFELAITQGLDRAGF